MQRLNLAHVQNLGDSFHELQAPSPALARTCLSCKALGFSLVQTCLIASACHCSLLKVSCYSYASAVQSSLIAVCLYVTENIFRTYPRLPFCTAAKPGTMADAFGLQGVDPHRALHAHMRSFEVKISLS